MNTDTGFYRDLEPNERHEPGDEWLHPDHNKWYEIGSGIHGKEVGDIYKCRRPVTPSPEYRLLGFGETVREGDEWHQPMSPMEFMWKPVTDQTPTTGVIGQPLTDRRIEVRRPVTPTPLVGDASGLRTPSTLNPNDPKKSAGELKPPLWLLPVSIMEETAWVLKGGAEKYGIRNYRHNKVCASTYISAIMRHLNKWREREDLDTESGRSHLAHIAANCAILMDAAQHGTLEDDRA